jgi:hypothetical protein
MQPSFPWFASREQTRSPRRHRAAKAFGAPEMQSIEQVQLDPPMLAARLRSTVSEITGIAGDSPFSSKKCSMVSSNLPSFVLML